MKLRLTFRCNNAPSEVDVPDNTADFLKWAAQSINDRFEVVAPGERPQDPQVNPPRLSSPPISALWTLHVHNDDD
jgi:hypothetical protein